MLTFLILAVVGEMPPPAPASAPEPAAAPAAAPADSAAPVADAEPGKPAEPTAPAELKVAVYDVSEPWLDARRSRLFLMQLVAEIDKLEGVSAALAGGGDLETARQTCQNDRSCLARLAQVAGGDTLVIARTTPMGASKALSLKRLSLVNGEIVQAVTRTVSGGEGEELLLVLGTAVQELFPEQALASGVVRGVPDSIAERWTPNPLPPAAFYGGLAATGGAAAIGAIYSILTRQAQTEFNSFVRAGSGGDSILDGKTLTNLGKKGETDARNANIAWAGTALFAVGTGVIYAFIDWDQQVDTELGITAGGAP